jgi:hypothetical protein
MIIVKYKNDNCRGSDGYYGQLCEPHYIQDTIYVLCAHCNWREVLDLQTCKAETQYGAKCKRIPRTETGYCSHHQHEDEAEKARLWYSRSKMILDWQMVDALDVYADYVYVIAAAGFVKIGHSVNPEQRLKTLQAGKDKTLRPKQIENQELKLIKKIKGGRNLEQMLHRMCSRSWVIGEWFKHDSYVSEVIERLNDQWVKNQIGYR